MEIRASGVDMLKIRQIASFDLVDDFLHTTLACHVGFNDGNAVLRSNMLKNLVLPVLFRTIAITFRWLFKAAMITDTPMLPLAPTTSTVSIV
jgi:hypothetical protein